MEKTTKKQLKLEKVEIIYFHTCTKRLVQYSIPTSSLGKSGAPVDNMIPPSILHYIKIFLDLICNVSDVNWMNDDLGCWGLRRKKMLHSKHNLVS